MNKVESFIHNIWQYPEEYFLPEVGSFVQFFKESNPEKNEIDLFFSLCDYAFKTKVKLFSKLIPPYKVMFTDMLKYDLKSPSLLYVLHMTKTRILSVFTILKNEISVESNHNKFTVNINLALKPKYKNENLDMAVQKLRGYIFSGEVPSQLRDKFKEVKGKAKSTLPQFTSRFNETPLILFYHYHVSPSISISLIAARDNVLVLKTQFTLKPRICPWLNEKGFEKLIQNLVKNSIRRAL